MKRRDYTIPNQFKRNPPSTKRKRGFVPIPRKLPIIGAGHFQLRKHPQGMLLDFYDGVGEVVKTHQIVKQEIEE